MRDLLQPPSHSFETTRSRIVGVLRRGGLTVDDMASQLRLSHNAVRVQLTRMERDGLVTRARAERRTTRPSQIFELTPAAEHLLSKAYLPFLTRLVSLYATRHSDQEFAAFMRAAGRMLAEDLRAKPNVRGSIGARVTAASTLLNSEFGALTEVERVDGRWIIRGFGCPLSAVTGKHPAVCLAVESLLTELIHSSVKECCSREEPPRCCFEVRPAHLPAARRSRPGRPRARR